MFDALHHPLKAALDIAALAAVLGALVGFLPAIASLFTIAWYGIQIYEYRRDKKGTKDDT